jgi:CarD family transcriptional regulator
MEYQINDHVVHPTHGVGRVVGLVNRSITGDHVQSFYEIALHRSTVWIPVGAGPAASLRRLTPRDELTRYREILRGPAALLITDHRQRHLDLQNRLKPGLFANLCEVVRDLTARSWLKPLNERDSAALRRSRDDLCQEWAVADGVPLLDATHEINALLQEGRLAQQA